MPGTLVGTINWKSSFNPAKDGEDLCKIIENSCQKPYAGLTGFFWRLDKVRSRSDFRTFLEITKPETASPPRRSPEMLARSRDRGLD